MTFRYVVVHGVEFPRRKKRSVLVGVTLTPEEAQTVRAQYLGTGHNVEVMDETKLVASTWLGPGGRLALKKLLTEKESELSEKADAADSDGECERLLRMAGQVRAHRERLQSKAVLP